ncbi:MAG: hypothetical protein E7597_05600 [Ruminococcaceae bacterium]|nr:hypothetical protein [Oscillospiraceae bacterium]
MIKKKLIILAVAALLVITATVLALSACDKDEGVSFKGTSQKTAPIEKAVSAIYNGDGDAYYSAFPSALKEHYEESYVVAGVFAPCKNMSEYLSTYMVKVNKANYGEDYAVAVEFLSEEQISVAELDAMHSDPNLDYYTYKRFVTEDNTEEVWRIKLKLSYSGSYGEEEKDQTVYVVKQNGKWYLHPHYVFYSF